MKTRTLGICLFLLMNVSFIKGQSLADKVDMWMGTYGAGHCVVGPQLPHGSVNPSPQTAYGGHAGMYPISRYGALDNCMFQESAGGVTDRYFCHLKSVLIQVKQITIRPSKVKKPHLTIIR